MTTKQRIKNFFLGIYKFFEIMVIDVIFSRLALYIIIDIVIILIFLALSIILSLLIVNWMWG